MPFNLRLASRHKCQLSQQAAKAKVASQKLHEFYLGVCFGLGLIAALFATYWLITRYGAGFVSLQSLQHWFGF